MALTLTKFNTGIHIQRCKTHLGNTHMYGTHRLSTAPWLRSPPPPHTVSQERLAYEAPRHLSTVSAGFTCSVVIENGDDSLSFPPSDPVVGVVCVVPSASPSPGFRGCRCSLSAPEAAAAAAAPARESFRQQQGGEEQQEPDDEDDGDDDDDARAVLRLLSGTATDFVLRRTRRENMTIQPTVDKKKHTHTRFIASSSSSLSSLSSLSTPPSPPWAERQLTIKCGRRHKW